LGLGLKWYVDLFETGGGGEERSPKGSPTTLGKVGGGAIPVFGFFVRLGKKSSWWGLGEWDFLCPGEGIAIEKGSLGKEGKVWKGWAQFQICFVLGHGGKTRQRPGAWRKEKMGTAMKLMGKKKE